MFLTRCVVAVALLAASDVAAQPSLASLWPNQDGALWQYRITAASPIEEGENFTADDAIMRLSGTVQTPGGTAQNLVATHGTSSKARAVATMDPFLRAVWRARPDLRAAIESRTRASSSSDQSWLPLLLHGGPFFKFATAVQMWQVDQTHPTWTYLTNDLGLGATFTQQLIPELADNVFLHGTVEAIDETVQTAGGPLAHAVRIGYWIDYGWASGVDEYGDPIGSSFRSSTRGYVHYVPGLGPVDLLEDFIPYAEVDCDPNGCPADWVVQLGQSLQHITLSLLTTTVTIAPRTWSLVKAAYR